MRGHGIGVALGKVAVDQLPLLQRVERAYLGDAGVIAIEKQALGLGGGLHDHRLARQIGKRLNVAVRHDGYDLMAVHIRPDPSVFVRAAAHRKAAPDAVDDAVFKQLVFFGPVDRDKFGAVAHAAERLVGQLHINADSLSVGVYISKGRVVITADGDDRQVSICIGGVCGTACQQHAGKPESQKQTEKVLARLFHRAAPRSQSYCVIRHTI